MTTEIKDARVAGGRVRANSSFLERKARFSPTREKLPWKIELRQLLWAYHDWILRVGFYNRFAKTPDKKSGR